MPKVAYPTLGDLAFFLAAAKLVPTTTVATGAASSATHTLTSVSGLTVGDSVYFSTLGAAKAVTAINTSTKVITVASCTTVTGEQVIFLPQILDLTGDLASGIADWERAAGRTMLATADTTRTFDPPIGTKGILDLKADLAAITSVSVLGTAQTVATHYRALPQDAPGDGRPWNRLEFLARWLYPFSWANNGAVSIVGKWGYSATAIPDDAWRGMLAASTLLLLPQLAQAVAGGLVSWTEAGVTESYGNQPYQAVLERMEMRVARSVANYRRVCVGL